VELRSERVLLRELGDDDFETTHAYGSDPEVVRYMAWGPNSPDETRDFIRRARASADETPRHTFELAIVARDRGADQHIGGCGLMGRRVAYREYEVGYCLAPDAWGRGLASESMKLLLEFAFSDFAAHRLYACIDPGNHASQAVVEKAGFRREGLQRHDTMIRGKWRDSLIYALLGDEYR
jgi:ribosomal-protein-alanine N-acetyltransferase